MYNKKNGVYYTPSALAEYLAEPLIQGNGQSVLDPSYGEGSLLLAAERAFKKKNKTSRIELFGCDTKPVNGLLKHLPKANLKESDFFDYRPEANVWTILMNPPYVRHHIQDLEKIKKYRASFPNLSLLNNSADLWAYFLIKSVSHLQKGGNVGAILPWAFLQADYAQPLRKWLADSFGDIKVLALSNKYFEHADERVVLIWLKELGQKCNSIKIASAQDIEQKVSYSNLPLANWISDRVLYSGNSDITSILNRYKNEFGFTEFENHADVKIGVVTGANKYFVVPTAKAKELGFKASQLKPILTSSKEFSRIINGNPNHLKKLISIGAKDASTCKKFIDDGVESEYNLRTHSILRVPWYAVKVGKVPDAFFPYRITSIPYLITNPFKIQSTNSIHRIYFKNLSDLEIKWIQVSLLSLPGQLSLEAHSKTYGRGILKIEPKSLKNALVVKRNDVSINSVYPQIIELLSCEKKEEAMRVASEFIYRELKIPIALANAAESVLSRLQSMRITKAKV